MKFYNNIIEVQLPQDLIELAKQFAVAVAETTNYADSNQFSKQKIIDDHFISKLGEEAVRTVFSQYATVKGPDYDIYEGKGKSWEEDLYIDGVGLGVKTQKRTSALRYGLSWTFQAGSFRRDMILNDPEAWICFVELNDLSGGNICYVYPVFQIKELIFREPVLAKLKGHKLVAYATDLKLG